MLQDCYKIASADKVGVSKSKVGEVNKCLLDTGDNGDLEPKIEDDGALSDRSRGEKARITLVMMKAKIAFTPIHKYF